MSVRKAFSFSILWAMLVLGGCMSTPPGTLVVFNEDVPAEESAHIFIQYGLEITTYNGIPVPVKETVMQLSGIKSEWHNMILPAGETEFTLDVGLNHTNNTIYTGKNLTFKYTFEPSTDHLYFLYFVPDGGTDKNEKGIGIIKKPLKETKWYKAENIIGFVPFHQESERIILE